MVQCLCSESETDKGTLFSHIFYLAWVPLIKFCLRHCFINLTWASCLSDTFFYYFTRIPWITFSIRSFFVNLTWALLNHIFLDTVLLIWHEFNELHFLCDAFLCINLTSVILHEFHELHFLRRYYLQALILHELHENYIPWGVRFFINLFMSSMKCIFSLPLW